MTNYLVTQSIRQSRRGSLPLPVVIALVLAVVVIGVLIFNTIFYGKSISLLDERLVLADVEDFPQFLRECGDDDASSKEIVTMREDPTGNCMFFKIQLLLKYVYEKKGTQTGQIIIRADDFVLSSGDRTWPAVLLSGGSPAQLQDGSEQIVMRALTLRRGPDGGIVEGAIEEKEGEEASLGDLVRGVRQMHGAASIGGGGARSRGVLDWVRAPLEERSKIVQPPALAGYVWRAELSQNKQDAWRAVEMVCLFPAPPPGTDARLVVFGDGQNAIPVAVP